MKGLLSMNERKLPGVVLDMSYMYVEKKRNHSRHAQNNEDEEEEEPRQRKKRE